LKGEDFMKKFCNTDLDEQETIIHIDYFNKQVNAYTSRKSIYERLCRKIGKPQETYCTKNKISGAKWIISFSDKKIISSLLSRPTLIGNIK
jgi:hypothetical protein